MLKWRGEAATARRGLGNAVIGVVAACGLAVAAPAQVTEVFLAPDDHTDYFWTADDATYRDWFGLMIDYYLDLADATDAAAPDLQSRWNLDGSLWFWEYERTRPAAQVERLVERLRSGHFSMPLNPLVVNLGAAPAEAVLRGMYYAGSLERRYDLRFPMAITMENQTQPLGLAQLWAGSGCLYSWKGICDCATRVAGAGARDHEIYRYTGTDGSSVVMKWNSLITDNQSIGGYAEARFPAQVTDFVTVNAPFNGFLARYPYSVAGAFGYGWDDSLTRTDLFVTTVPGLNNPGRRVRVSNQIDFFERFGQVHGFAALPAETLSYGNEWDLHCASLAETTSRVKRASERLRGAEAMAAFVSRFNPTFMGGRDAARDLAFLNMGLYWEHNFGMDGRGEPEVSARIAWQNRLANEIDSYVNTLRADAITSLGALIPAAPGATRFAAFNPLSWERDAAVDIPWPGPNDVHVVEVATGRALPSQLITTPADPESSGTGPVLRVLASGVPPLGYATLEVRVGPAPGPVLTPAATVQNVGARRVVTSASLRVEIAPPGVITSIIELASGRELVNTSLARGLNDLGGPLDSGSIVVENSGPASVTLRCTATNPVARTTRITVYREGVRLDIANRITQNFDSVLSWRFPFAVATPVTHHEEVGAVLTAKLATSGGHYATRAARYDWLTLNHFADVSDSGTGPGVTLSNADAAFFKLGSSDVFTLDANSSTLSVLAGGRGLGSDFGLPAQGGATSFLQRFAIRPHGAYDQASAMRFALEHQNPVIAVPVSGAASAPLPATRAALVRTSDPDVLVWAFKPTEDDPDLAWSVRLWNMAAAPRTVTIDSVLGPIGAAGPMTHIESAYAPEAIGAECASVTLAGQQMRTIRLERRGSWDATGDGAVNIDDLYQQTQQPADLNQDGVISAYDTQGLARDLRRTENDLRQNATP